MRPTLIFAGLAAYFLIASATRAWARRTARPGTKPALSLPDTLQFLGGTLFAAAMLLALPLFAADRSLLMPWLLALAVLLSAVIDFAAATRWPSPIRNWRVRLPVAITTLLTGATLFAFALHLRSVPGDNAQALRCAWPVRGTWLVATGGRTGITNYHHGHPAAQDCAVDLVMPGPPGASRGEPVFAPVNGRAVAAVNDQTEGEGGAAEGNIVIIETPEGVRVSLAHLAEQSVRVREGDHVTQGQVIAAVGATGSAVQPHLHIHAQRGETAVPILFGPRAQFLLRNQVIEAQAAP